MLNVNALLLTLAIAFIFMVGDSFFEMTYDYKPTLFKVIAKLCILACMACLYFIICNLN